MELIRREDIKTVPGSGVELQHLLNSGNSTSQRVTLTRVITPPGATSPPHAHETMEQVWIALDGEGTLLLAGDRTEPFRAGDVARFAEGDLHGFTNTGTAPFVHIAVTAPAVRARSG